MTGTVTAPAHTCPGGCRRPVPHRYFACPACWRRLPAFYKDGIRATYRHNEHAHNRALVAAMSWYRDNPPHRPHGTGVRNGQQRSTTE